MSLDGFSAGVKTARTGEIRIRAEGDFQASWTVLWGLVLLACANYSLAARLVGLDEAGTTFPPSLLELPAWRIGVVAPAPSLVRAR